MTKEALTLALEALETKGEHHPRVYQAITAIKEALAQPEQEKERCVGCEACIDTACGRDECPKGWPKAAQPEQEPVARVVEHGATVKLEWANADAAHNAKVGNLYTTPPQRKPLLASDIVTMYDENPRCDADMVEFARAIEAAHGIKE